MHIVKLETFASELQSLPVKVTVTLKDTKHVKSQNYLWGEEYQTGNSLVGHSKRFSFIFFFPYFACLRYTLYSEVRPKSTNHHSHNCNYCINTKQHTGDVWNVYDLNETRKRLQYTMARKTKQKCKHSRQKKKVTITFFFFFSVSFGFIMLQSLTTKT